jgi:hypothetical protein
MMTTNDSFLKNGFCVVKSVISDELRDFVTQYTMFDESQNFSPEKQDGSAVQVPNAHSKYADPAMETLLLHIHRDVQNHTGLKLYPTYSYYRVYRNGDSLEKHVDRPSCEISATLCLNYGYDSGNYSWPIFMNGTPVVLEPGDMVIYRGCELDHWREQFNPPECNSWQVQGFFHYVDKDGSNADWKHDKRAGIGVKKIVKKLHVVQQSEKSYIEYLN